MAETKSKEATMINDRMGSGEGCPTIAAGVGYKSGFCLTSLLMMLEASVNSNLMKFTDDAKSRGVTNSSEG